MNLLLRKVAGMALSFTLCGNAFGTTCVVVVTPKRIVAGSDRLFNGGGPSKEFTGRGATVKMVLIGGRFVVASVNLEKFWYRQKGTKRLIVYEFSQWIKAVESQVNFATTVSDLMTIVEKESALTFTKTIPIEDFMRDGTIKRSKAFDRFLVQFVVAGFENGIPYLTGIDYELDWNNYRLIGPTRRVQFPRRDSPNAGIYDVGETCEIDQIAHPNTYVQKRLNTATVAAIDQLRHTADVNANDAADLVRSLIAVEAELHPHEVGAGDMIITVPLEGPGYVTTHRVSIALPKNKPSNKPPTETECEAIMKQQGR